VPPTAKKKGKPWDRPEKTSEKQIPVKIRLQHDQIILDSEDASEDEFLSNRLDQVFQEFDLMFFKKMPTPKTMPGIGAVISRMLNEWRVRKELS